MTDAIWFGKCMVLISWWLTVISSFFVGLVCLYLAAYTFIGMWSLLLAVGATFFIFLAVEKIGVAVFEFPLKWLSPYAE